MKDFFANIFEFWGSFRSSLSTDLYDFVYLGAGFIILIFILIMVGIFYFVLYPKTAKFDTIYHWVLWLLGSTVLSIILIGSYTKGRLNREGLYPNIMEYLEFLIVVLFWSVLIFFLFSLIFKSFGHPSRRRLPF